ncbi:MAG: phospholipid carrier-dependent glycosyltransferase [Minicystis sp.]
MSAQRRLRDRLAKHRDLVIVTLAALAVRLLWNLAVHRPTDYAFSDMGGYLERAQTSIDHFGERFGYFTLFPWGTHFLLMLVKRAFGRANAAAVCVTYALLGAGAVAYTFLVARRLTRSVWIPRAVGLVLILYYPWISLGGYILSEPPFTLFLSATAYYGLVLADRGRPRDAWRFGIALALAAAFRPQILMALPLYGLHVLARRRAWRRLSPRFLLGVAVPIVIVLGVSIARMEFHIGRFGLISNNGPLNYAFGRCHATMITSTAPDRKGAYSPPSLGSLAGYEKDHPGTLFKLRPAIDTKLNVQGHMWDAEPMYELASKCVQKTGLGRQIEYAVTHVVLLWGYNVIWPDSGQKPPFRRMMEVASALHGIFVLPAAVVALALAFRRRHARVMLLALHVFALLAVAAIYFGDTRLRAPYDGILVVLAAMTYASAYRWARRRRARSLRAGAPS